MQHNHIVIMAGGIGSRFWPLSTPDYPKQFIDILGCGRTLIQLTVDRFQGLAPLENFWVVTNAKYVGIVQEQLPGIPAAHILAEPQARNTAPCIAWACWKIRSEDADANIVVTPSDAVVLQPEEFRRVIGNALRFTAVRDAVVTVGIRPSRPETGYGYVEVAPSCPAPEGHPHIRSVQQFREKPDRKTAEQYLRAGNFLWNAGIFVWNARTIHAFLHRYSPQIAELMERIAAAFGTPGERAAVEELFPQCEKISIDYAVMEPASREGRVFTHPADFGWSDLGNWASLHDKLTLDASGNGVVGPAVLYECHDCVVHVEDERRVVLQGLDGYIVSEKNGQLLVCRRSEEQRIKEFSN